MIKKRVTVTGRIYDVIFDVLKENPEGVSWSELLKKIQQENPDFHPKTVNGCVWKLVEKYPDKVYKPQKGVFALKRSANK